MSAMSAILVQLTDLRWLDRHHFAPPAVLSAIAGRNERVEIAQQPSETRLLDGLDSLRELEPAGLPFALLGPALALRLHFEQEDLHLAAGLSPIIQASVIVICADCIGNHAPAYPASSRASRAAVTAMLVRSNALRVHRRDS